MCALLHLKFPRVLGGDLRKELCVILRALMKVGTWVTAGRVGYMLEGLDGEGEDRSLQTEVNSAVLAVHST